MKKLVFALVALATVSFAACNSDKAVNPEEAANALVDSLKANVDNPEKIATLISEAQAKIEELTQAGDSTALNQYTQIIKDVIAGDVTLKEAIEKVAGNVGGETITNFVNKLTGNGEAAVENAADNANAAVEGAKEELKAEGEAAKEAVKEAATQAANEAVNKASEKAAEKVNEGVNKGLKKLGL